MAFPELDSTIVISLVFVVSCLVIIRSFWSGRKSRFPPSPRALPIIGNLHQLGQAYLHRTLRDLAQRHGPLFSVRLGSMPAIVVSSPSVAETVLKTQDSIFCSRSQTYSASGIIYGCRDISFSPYGEQWRQSRRVAVVHILSTKRVDSFRSLRADEVSRFVQQIRDAGKDGMAVNLTELIVRLTNTAILKTTFGNKLGGVDPEMFGNMMKEVADTLDVVAVGDLFPWLGWLDRAMGLDARVKKTAAKLDAIFEGVLTEHERTRGDCNSDLLDDLLWIVKDGDKLDRTEVKALMLDMFAAGIDTIYKTTEWTMAQLIKNPREMEKVQSEVRQVAAGEGVLEEELEKMTYLHAVIKESLRLLPVLIPRETIQDTRLHGYDIPAKTWVIINTYAIMRDSESWENSEEFRPARFLGAGRAVDYSGKDTKFIPFGAGRRGCPGITFGTRILELTLANMIYHFDWELPDGQDAEAFELVESAGFTPHLKSDLILVAKPLC